MEPAPEDSEGAEGASALALKRAAMERQFQHLLDKSTVFVKGRWIGFGVAMLLYLIRVYFVNGWYIITYGLGIYLLNLFIGFLSPQIDPETEDPLLPTSDKSGEFRPFTRRVPEFKFWYKATKATVVSFFLTFFEVFNIPVFWPILLVYFIALTFLTMKRQIKHMWKHKYLPWSTGKTTYGGDAGGAPMAKAAE